MNKQHENEIIINDTIITCEKCTHVHICKRCVKNMHVCTFCGKITHECDFCGMIMDSLSSIKKHQNTSKFCKKTRCKTTLSMEEFLSRFNIVIKSAELNPHRRKSIC